MKYTLAVTSCNRFPLLQKTLESFLKWADECPVATVIVDDSGAAQPDFLSQSRYRALGRGRWISNGTRRGQIYSLDRLYEAIETPYVFHLEDDWLFTRGRFMGPSFEILNRYPQISSVSLRGADCNGHPLTSDPAYPFPIQEPGWMGGWGGYGFNPGLRRLADLKEFGGSFGRFVGYGTHGCGHEQRISAHMLAKGFRTAVLHPNPHVKHLGEGVSRAIEPLPKAPRALLAVPVSHQYDYGTHTSGIKRETSGRVEAVRDTWMQDAAKFPNVTAQFFYGCRPANYPMLPDAVYLDCPDDYTHLPQKIKALCRYALENGFDYLIKSDDDTVIHVDRLMRSGFDAPGVDQMGCFDHCKHVNGQRCQCYVTGMCYTLSRRAMRLVADAPFLDASHCLNWAEDYWVGGVLRAAGIRPTGHPGWVSGQGGHYVKFPLPRNTVAAHSVRPDDMRAWYRGVL